MTSALVRRRNSGELLRICSISRKCAAAPAMAAGVGLAVASMKTLLIVSHDELLSFDCGRPVIQAVSCSNQSPES